MLRILDPASLTDRAAASLVEVKESVSTWPQLASDVALGGAMVANAVRRIALGELTGLRPLLRRPRRADRGRAPGAAAPAPPPAAPPAPGRRRRGCRPPAPGRRRPRGAALRRRVRDLGAVRRQHAAVALRGARRTSSARGSTRRAPRCWTSATGPRCSRSAPRWRRRRSARARSASSRSPRAVAADGPGVGARARARHGTPATSEAVELLWQRCCNRRTGASPPIADAELARLARRGAPLDTRVVAARRAGGARHRARRARPRALPLAPAARDMIGELRFTAQEAQASRDGIDVAVARARRRRPRRDGRPAHRRRDGLPRAARPRPRPRQRRRATRSSGRPARSSCARRASTAPRWSTPAAASCGCGSRPRAGTRDPSVGLAVPLPAPARGRRLAGGVGAQPR